MVLIWCVVLVFASQVSEIVRQVKILCACKQLNFLILFNKDTLY